MDDNNHQPYNHQRGRIRGGRQMGFRSTRDRMRGNYERRFNNNHNDGANPTTGNEFQIHDEILTVEETGFYYSSKANVRIAIQGCCHGNIERIYDVLEERQRHDGKQIDLLICCGDFQALRNTSDFDTISVPQKYKDIGTFYKYYSGEKKAPVLTIFIGGNHEASAYLQELYYGGWVAPNIYYLGASGVVQFEGLRISGISGIYKLWDYKRGRHEIPPYNDKTLRSVYHVRNVEAGRLKCLANQKTNKEAVTDIMISHDWPRGIEQHGNFKKLIQKKKHFKDEIQSNSLGSPCNEELLKILKPKYWFAAHLHVKFKATYTHDAYSPTTNQTNSANAAKSLLLKPSCMIKSSDVQTNIDEKQSSTEERTIDETTEEDFIALPKSNKDSIDVASTSFIGVESSSKICSQGVPDLTDLMTEFLSLDKCLPRKRHLHIVNIPRHTLSDNDDSPSLHYDLEWLAILQKTNHWLSPHNIMVPEPEIDTIHITPGDIDSIRNKLKEKNHLTNIDDSDVTKIPNNFQLSLQPHGTIGSDHVANGGCMVGNSQTDEILGLLGLDHIITVPYVFASSLSLGVTDTNEINIDDVSEGGLEPDSTMKGEFIDSNEIDIDDVNDDEEEEVEVEVNSIMKGDFIDSNEIDIDE